MISSSQYSKVNYCITVLHSKVPELYPLQITARSQEVEKGRNYLIRIGGWILLDISYITIYFKDSNNYFYFVIRGSESAFASSVCADSIPK